jgi:hypothetical protein
MKFTACVAVPCVLLLLTPPVSATAEDLSTELMKATFKVVNVKSTATGFFLSRPDPDQPKKTQLILVTAAHVFETMAGDEAALVFRRKVSEGVYRKVPVKLVIRRQGKALWTRHPTADVAVMAVDLVPEAEIPKLPLDLLAGDETLKKYEIHPGDHLLLLGYPHRVEANEAGFPILRSGPIATFPLVPTKTHKTFLISANSFEGDSGGPVYLAEPSRRFGGKKKPEEVRLILGLVVGQHFLNEEAKMIYATRTVRHRLGLAIVVHASFIRETIERLPGGR